MAAKFLSILTCILAFASVSNAAASANRCYMYGSARLYVSISAGSDFYNSRDVVSGFLSVEDGFKNLQALQAAGTCPAPEDVNNLKCFIYSSSRGYSMVSIGESLHMSRDIYAGNELEEALPVAKKLVELGQCNEMVVGKGE